MVIPLLKCFTFAADTGQTVKTEWIAFPAQHQNAQLVVIVHGRTGTSSINVILPLKEPGIEMVGRLRSDARLSSLVASERCHLGP